MPEELASAGSVNQSALVGHIDWQRGGPFHHGQTLLSESAIIVKICVLHTAFHKSARSHGGDDREAFFTKYGQAPARQMGERAWSGGSTVAV